MNGQQIIEQIDIGSGALIRGDQERARGHFLIAARNLLELAKQSQDEVLRQKRIEHANRLILHAHTLGDSSDTPTSEGGGEDATSDGENGSEENAFNISARPDIRFEDVLGNEEIKKTLRAKFLYPLQNPEMAARYGQQASGGVLLYGPPGTGKTLMVRALAGELNAPIFTVKPSEIMSRWVGEAEQNIAALFAEARQHPVALIFIDEIEALVPDRNDQASEVMGRIVPQFLAEMDGFERGDNNLLFLAASNLPWKIDSAMMRPGRFDERCYVGLPQLEARLLMLENHMSGIPLDDEVDLRQLASDTEGYSGADLRGLALKAPQAAYLDAIEQGIERPVTHEDLQLVLQGMQRSVTDAMLEEYAQYRDQ